jgi:hypothetical protein
VGSLASLKAVPSGFASHLFSSGKAAWHGPCSYARVPLLGRGNPRLRLLPTLSYLLFARLEETR